MKPVLTLLALVLSLALPELGHAASKCMVKTHDIGTIVGKGSSSSDAFEDAVSQCFDRRSQLYRMKKGSMPDEDTAVAFIDVCANITCEG